MDWFVPLNVTVPARSLNEAALYQLPPMVKLYEGELETSKVPFCISRSLVIIVFLEILNMAMPLIVKS